MSTALARIVGAAGLIVLVTAGPAFAHATLKEKSAPAGTVQTLTLQVPGEEAPAYTTSVVTEVLAGFTEVACAPKTGWTCTVTPDTAQGRSAVLTWTRQGTGASGVDTLPFQVRTPYAGGAFAFETTQTYSTGEKAFWDGEAGSDAPAPVLTVTGTAVSPPPAATTPPATTPAPSATPSLTATEPDSGDDGPSVVLIGVLSGVALLSGLGFYVVRRHG